VVSVRRSVSGPNEQDKRICFLVNRSEKRKAFIRDT
jgi:hypothetical protein